MGLWARLIRVHTSLGLNKTTIDVVAAEFTHKNSNTQTAPSEKECIIFELDESWIDTVFEIEQACSQNPWGREVLLRELERGFSLRPGLSLDGELIGQAFSYLVKDELHILNIAVLPEHRGLGYGKTLLSNLLETSISKGAEIATLEVRESNEVAKNLYKSYDFKHMGTRQSYYQNNGEDALIYIKRLVNKPSITAT